MKAILLISIGLITLTGVAFCQCPEGGLKIQMPGCEDPKNLMVNNVSCSSLSVNWQGNKNQAYLLKTTFTDPASNKIFKTEGVKVSCDDNGKCGATILAREHTNISWSVQAVCSIDDVTIYSVLVNGPDASVLLCEKVINIIKPSSLHVYPNPTINYLNVQLKSEAKDNIEFRIFDVAGKQVYGKTVNIVSGKINSYHKLDLRSMPAGTYLLEVHNGKEEDHVKFVKLRSN